MLSGGKIFWTSPEGLITKPRRTWSGTSGTLACTRTGLESRPTNILCEALPSPWDNRGCKTSHLPERRIHRCGPKQDHELFSRGCGHPYRSHCRCPIFEVPGSSSSSLRLMPSFGRPRCNTSCVPVYQPQFRWGEVFPRCILGTASRRILSCGCQVVERRKAPPSHPEGQPEGAIFSS